MKIIYIIAFCGTALSALRGGITDPVGSITLTIKGESDTRISIPLLRPVAYEGRVSAITANAITATDSPNWAEGEFVYGDSDSDNPANSYYLVLLTGNLEGAHFLVSANSSDALTLDLLDEALAGVKTDAIDGAGMGDLFQIVPYWTPATIFDGAQIPEQTSIAIRDLHTINTFKAPDLYTYFNGWGWYDGEFVLSDDVPIEPGQGMQIRTPTGSSDFTLVVSGSVPMFANRRVLKTTDTSGNDYDVGIISPIDTSLGNAGLNLQDQMVVMTWDNTVAQYFKSPKNYTYYSSVGLWSDGSFNVADDILLPAGESFMIRKPTTGLNDSVDWIYTPDYFE